jgi:phosphohistidine phosphatase SixA
MHRLIVAAALVALLPAAVRASAEATDNRAIFLVRHAERADDPPEDQAKQPAMAAGLTGADPELSAIGLARARRLAEMLRHAGVRRIFTTEYRRTRQTAEPLASAVNVEIAGVPSKDVPGLVEKLKASTGVSLVVGHSNTIPDILKALGVAETVRIPDDEYDNLFLVIPRDAAPQLLKLKY